MKCWMFHLEGERPPLSAEQWWELTEFIYRFFCVFVAVEMDQDFAFKKK